MFDQLKARIHDRIQAIKASISGRIQAAKARIFAIRARIDKWLLDLLSHFKPSQLQLRF